MNSKLYDKDYYIPQDVQKYLSKALEDHPNGKGSIRAKNLLNQGKCTYQEMKRLKNFFDKFSINKNKEEEYYLAGGTPMKLFVEKELEGDRKQVERSNHTKQDVGLNKSASFIKSSFKSGLSL